MVGKWQCVFRLHPRRTIGITPTSGPYSEEPTRNSRPEDVIVALPLRSTAQYSPPVTAGWGFGLIS